LRPDEANWLEYRDVEIVKDEATGHTILEIKVRGKRGVRYCKGTSGAVFPFKRMVARNKPKLTDKLWPAAGFVDTEIRCLTELESWNAETEVQPRVPVFGRIT
jgi:hypothetical protein